MNNKNGYAVHILFRTFCDIAEVDKVEWGVVARQEAISSFEEELAQFKASGYTVESFALETTIIYALLTKKLSDVPKSTPEGQ